jgi:general secretion pathway protein J
LRPAGHDGAARRLVLRWRPYLHATWLVPRPPMTETELPQNVEGLDPAYWRPGGGWASACQGRDLPAPVRIRLLFAAGDRRHWSDVVVAPLLDPS